MAAAQAAPDGVRAAVTLSLRPRRRREGATAPGEACAELKWAPPVPVPATPCERGANHAALPRAVVDSRGDGRALLGAVHAASSTTPRRAPPALAPNSPCAPPPNSTPGATPISTCAVPARAAPSASSTARRPRRTASHSPWSTTSSPSRSISSMRSAPQDRLHRGRAHREGARERHRPVGPGALRDARRMGASRGGGGQKEVLTIFAARDASLEPSDSRATAKCGCRSSC